VRNAKVAIAPESLNSTLAMRAASVPLTATANHQAFVPVCCVNFTVFPDDGASVGRVVGAVVGRVVGAVVGRVVGAVVGGAEVGTDVGTDVGADVGGAEVGVEDDP
jgi:hypothetical protein